ncbi:eukaryotic-like serine/threonine-protein kinase [Frankia sp. AiPs1]|uniref:WD40 repeat domain-containing serine/threonine protein kinase n=1 Tax=Frankia sp. AiPa1 TaxID=573492 RepID=UPI00202B400E|nr:serine/threonine-protein kinase [Frankia sp. AiPa1]MCL9761267.1 protein kinase [Frankia sp. AiPa1]
MTHGEQQAAQPWAVQPLEPEDPAQVGPYQLLGRLGAGGMGSVYLGRARRSPTGSTAVADSHGTGSHGVDGPGYDADDYGPDGDGPDGRGADSRDAHSRDADERSMDGRAVAVKLIRVELATDPQFRARFRREVELVRTVDGFCTAAVLDADPEAPRPYLVTEYLPGPTLRQKVKADGPLPADALKQLAVAVATGLTAIHRAGIVHRDLKPSNVLLSATGPKVIDFGVARAVDATSGLSHAAAFLGTPAFMAPEQIRHDVITPAADIFAWGGLIAYAGTGREPFGDDVPVHAQFYRTVHEQPRLDGLDLRLRPLVEAAMSKDPAARPNAHDLLMRLLGEHPTGDGGPGDNALGDDVPGHVSGHDPSADGGLSDPILADGVLGDGGPGAGRRGGTARANGPDATVTFDVSPVLSLPPNAAAAPVRPSPARRGRRLLAAIAMLAAVVVLVTTVVVWRGRGAGATDTAAVSRRIAAQSLQVSDTDPAQARRLAVAAFRLSPTAGSRAALIAAGLPVSQPEVLTDGDGQMLAVAFAPGGHALATASTGPSPGSPVCPAGSTASGSGQCVSPAQGNCPAGWTFSTGTSPPDGACLRTVNRTCPVGSTRHGQSCVSPPVYQCRTGGTLSQDRCLTTPDCPTGLTPEGQQCVADPVAQPTTAPTCASPPSGSPPRASPGTGASPGVNASPGGSGAAGCQPIAPICPDGQTAVSGRCVAPAICRSGTPTPQGCSRPAERICLLGTLTAAGTCETVLATACPDGSSPSPGDPDGADGADRPDGSGTCVRAATLTCPDGTTRTKAGCARPSEKICPSGQSLHILSCGLARMWTLPAHSPMPTLAGHTGPVFGLALSPDGQVLATGSGDTTVGLWDVHAPASPVRQATIPAHRGAVNALAFAPTGRLLATASSDRTIRLWDLATPTEPKQLATLPEDTTGVLTVAFAPNGRLLATAGVGGTIRLWDVSTPTRPTSAGVVPVAGGLVRAVTFAPDGHTLAAAHADGGVRLWDVTEPTHPHLDATVTHGKGEARSISFAPDGRLAASAGDGGSVRLWDTARPTAPAPLTTLTGHAGTVNTVAFAPDGRWLATAADDGTARLWSLDPAALIRAICARSDARMTPAAWAGVIPDVPYRSSCP